jgi:hypothetical protein
MSVEVTTAALGASPNMTVSGDMMDWNHGGLNTKLPLWIIYNFFNILGSLLCMILMIGIALLPSLSSVSLVTNRRVNGATTMLNCRTSADIFIISLCIGCILFSLPCALQCFMNMSMGSFAYGRLACDTEAFFHVSGILHQFLSLMAGGYRNYLAVVKNYILGERAAIIICCSLCVSYSTIVPI